VSQHISSVPDSDATPFFAALVEWARGDATVWGCPGHARGELFAKSQVGRAFREFFGDNVLLADASNAVEVLGQLLDHTGEIGAAEQRAARTFRADHLFFVLGGTSASNKMVWNATVGAGDIALVDRNCHKSVLHAIMLTGAVPVYLQPTRNMAGLIGPIPRSEFTRESIARKLAAHPLVADPDRTVRLIALTQSTYDGIVYHADDVKRLLDGMVDVFHFDEAWLPHAGFHDFYDGWHAIDNTRPRTERAIVYATQSTHKLLGGMTQASQVLVQNSESVTVDRSLFNESFMMHTSTSPQYSLLASCEIAAAIMRGEAGRELVADTLRESLDFRRAMNRAGTGRDWWFGTWGPDVPGEPGELPERPEWELSAGAAWHGFGSVDERFAMLDPTKVTVTSPGMSMDGEYAERGIPGVVMQKYLAEHDVITEKTSLYATLFIFTIGLPRGAWRSLVATLEQFKADYDANSPLEAVMPRFTRDHPAYAGRGLREVCDGLHATYRDGDIARLIASVYTELPEPDMLPADALRQLAAGNAEHVPVEELAGRTTAVLLAPYPPGIPLLVPGERVSEGVIRFLAHEATMAREWPGFTRITHGLAEGAQPGSYTVPCIAK
jgi:arginine decarboxylase